MLTTTGCDGVLVARGTMGAPWIASQIEEFLSKGTYKSVTFTERKAAFVQHLDLVMSYYGSEEKFLTETRKLCGHYLFSSARVRQLRGALAKASSPHEVYQLIHDFEDDEHHQCNFHIDQNI